MLPLGLPFTTNSLYPVPFGIGEWGWWFGSVTGPGPAVGAAPLVRAIEGGVCVL